MSLKDGREAALQAPHRHSGIMPTSSRADAAEQVEATLGAHVLYEAPYAASFDLASPRGRALAAAADPPITDQEKPTSLDQLPRTYSRAYDLSVTSAAELSIPVVGSVSGGYNRRVVVLERVAFKEIDRPSAVHHWGYAIRLAVTVSKMDANLKLALPVLAASAQLGQIEASWIMQVIGLAGPRIDEVSITPSELNVETFVLAKQSLTNLIAAVRDPSTQLVAQEVGRIGHGDIMQLEYIRAVGRAYALGRIYRRRRLADALAEIEGGIEGLREVIADTYREFAGLSDQTTQPSPEAQRRAAALLNGVTVEPR